MLYLLIMKFVNLLEKSGRIFVRLACPYFTLTSYIITAGYKASNHKVLYSTLNWRASLTPSLRAAIHLIGICVAGALEVVGGEGEVVVAAVTATIYELAMHAPLAKLLLDAACGRNYDACREC